MEYYLQRVTRQQAQKLKLSGFDWEVQLYYSLSANEDENEPLSVFGAPLNHNKGRHFSCPETALALKWLRDVKNVNGHVYTRSFNGLCYEWMILGPIETFEPFDTYEKAESSLLDYILENLIK